MMVNAGSEYLKKVDAWKEHMGKHPEKREGIIRMMEEAEDKISPSANSERSDSLGDKPDPENIRDKEIVYAVSLEEIKRIIKSYRGSSPISIPATESKVSRRYSW